MNNVLNYKDCTGCSACESVCVKGAISMVLNEDGFYEPSIKEELCTNCGKCISVCPLRKSLTEIKPMSQYACALTSDEKLFKSSSGGVFTGIAESILSQDGIVFGAAYKNDFSGVGHFSTEEVPLEALKKSKYVVSDLRNSFSEIKQLLKLGKKVLFVGTPCQCAGLKSVIPKNDNLIVVDFICGGTPSQKCFSQHFNNLAKKYKSEIVGIDFRGKENGWKKSYLTVTFKNGKKHKKYYLNEPYYSLFYMEHLSTRTICDKCPFRKHHLSDITIADFWGVFKTDIPNDDKGISLVAINTEKGKELFDKIPEKQVYPLTKKDIEYAYQEFSVSEDKIIKKQKFFNEMKNKDFRKVYKKYVKTGKIAVFIKRLRSYLGG